MTTYSSSPMPGVVAGRGEAERPEHAGEPAQHPREDVEPELDPLDADAREERRLLAGADREDRAAERRRVEHDGEDDRQHAEERDRVRDVRAGDRDDADVREVRREAADRVGRQDPLRDAAVERQRPDRHRQRRQADAGDEEAVERAEDHARATMAASIAGQIGQPCLNSSAISDAGEPEHRRDREIDLAGDDDQRQRQRHDRDLADVQADVEEVRRLQEVRWRRSRRTRSCRRAGPAAASPSG